NYDRCGDVLNKELETCAGNFQQAWAAATAGSTGNWAIIPKIYKDVCVKSPHLFVWVICSRDLSKVPPDNLERICRWQEQRKYNEKHPYSSDRQFLAVIDSFLASLQAERKFSVLNAEIVTNGAFPSTYHFRICEFATTS